MEFTEIGVLVKPHGLKGSVVLKVEAVYADQVGRMRQLFLSQFASMVPYKVIEVAPLHVNQFKLTLKGVETVGQAEGLRGIAVFQEAKLLVVHDELPLEGMTVFLKSGERVGQVQEVIENKAQILLAVVDEAGGEKLIPLVEQFVVSIDQSAMKMVLELPEGLLDI
jgi:16S rRNA processing protein RimM